MSCERFEDRLHDLLDRRLPAEEEAELRLHLAACGRCSQVFRELEELLATTRAIPEIDPPTGFADAIMGSVRKESGGRVHHGRFRLVSIGALGSLAAGFLLFILLQPSAERGRPSQAPAGEVELAKAAEKDRALGKEQPVSAPAAPEERFAFDKSSENKRDDSTRESNENVTSQLDTLETESVQYGNAPAPTNLGLVLSDEALRRAKVATPGPASTTVSYYAFVEKPEARAQLLASFALPATEDKQLKEADPPAGPTPARKAESAPEAGLGSSAFSDNAANTVRYRVPRAKLAALQEQWQKIPGLRVQEIPIPKPEADRGEKKNSQSGGGTYRGPGDSVPPGGESLIEIVITFLPPPPAEKPK